MENITKEYLTNGYIAHNSTQISLEINYEIIMFIVDDVQQFIIDNNLIE